MEYTQGYVCFIDVLGFSSYVKEDTNIEKTYGLFEFIKKFCYFFNDTKNLETQVSFYSDSIVITTSKLDWLIPTIYIAESYLKKYLGLLFRGGICYGKYYHENGITFGPGVVKAYELEKKAIYSRIVIDKDIQFEEDNFYYYVDIDGVACLNPYSMILLENLYFGEEVTYPEGDVNKIILDRFEFYRKEILSGIEKYKGTPVVEKYLWRIRPFNYTCNYIANMSCDEFIYEPIQYKNNDALKKELLNLVINNIGI